ncbi:MAG: T9SS type A sorting domain-containing protein [Ignavibacteriota bacterium]|nr:T9SS type A sorting domain-containing protein [Ignavibacteriota bacterium]
MKSKLSLKKATVGILTLIFLMSISLQIYSYPTGVAGRTLKPGSTNGCTCHQAALNAAVVVTVTGPATLAPGATGTYTFSVSRSSGTFSTGGIDIAVSSGTLALASGSTGLKILTSELVHSAKFTGATTKTFTVTAPATPGTITIYCTGAAGTNPPNWNNGANFTVNVATGISQIEEVAHSYSLSQNFPNPFNPTTNISFSLPKAGFVNISVYDITGKLVQELVNSNQPAGKFNVTWDANNFASGVYFYKIKSGDFTEMKKMSLIK